MATPDTHLATVEGEKIAAKQLAEGRKAEVMMLARPDGTILGGADAPVTVVAETTQEAGQHSAILGGLDLIAERAQDLVDAVGGGDGSIDSAGLTSLAVYGTVTSAQTLANVVDLALADIIERLGALEA